jgi:hypothetical protein
VGRSPAISPNAARRLCLVYGLAYRLYATRHGGCEVRNFVTTSARKVGLTRARGVHLHVFYPFYTRLPFARVPVLLMCATVAYKHTSLGVKKASIRIMRGKGGFFTAPRAEGEPGCITQ